MRQWLRGQRGGLAAFLIIAALVAGGLGWVTAAALRLESERIEDRANEQAQAERYEQLRLALWTLDGHITHILGREDSRPYNHYSAVYALSMTLQNDGNLGAPGSVLELSPLLNTDLPPWMLLHFQVDQEWGWGSPQVLTPALRQRLENAGARTPLVNVTPERAKLLADLAGKLESSALLSNPLLRGAQPTLQDRAMILNNLSWNNNSEQAQPPGNQEVEQQQRANFQSFANRMDVNYRVRQENPYKQQVDDLRVAFGNTVRNGEGWFTRPELRRWCSAQSSITLGPMVPLWLNSSDGRELLMVARMVRIDEKQVCQGILLDWPHLQDLLASEVDYLFPEIGVEPVRDFVPPHPERTLTALPVELNPGPLDVEVPATGFTPLRVGLALAWVAALVALGAVGLGGWSLIDLSERRFRFVSAVTHELRTPLTTLRLYLDMLTGGLVKDEARKEEYLHTLYAETERLNRLVGNVLDFSRLENQRPSLEIAEVSVPALLEQVRSDWELRCQGAGKDLVVDDQVGSTAALRTDVKIVQQILGNLVDNACKYSRSAADRRIWVRAHRDGPRRLVLEIEDRGPGVAPRERRSIFRPFRRGGDADVTAGGVGLGLALAQRWAALLGGRLALRCGAVNTGACFRLELPLR
jgi:signal transduction histidine kinase